MADLPTSLHHDRYTVVRELGSGGQASTFEAVDGRDGGRVAVKRFRVRGATSWKEVELAEREANVLASISHPAFPRYVEHFEEDGELFLVTELIEGESLADRLRGGGSVSEVDVVRFLRGASAALDHLHGADPPIIHRDIKPSNVLRRPDGSFAFIDFGSVRHRMKPQGGSTVAGTFGYMAPEQLHGRADPASDVYSVAATALALLTGREPEDLPHRGLAIDVQAALAPRRVDTRLVGILEAMLDPDPDRRPARMRPLLAKLDGDGASSGPRAREEARREDEAPASPRPRRREEIAGDTPGSIAVFRGRLTTTEAPSRPTVGCLIATLLIGVISIVNSWGVLLGPLILGLAIITIITALPRGRTYTSDFVVDVSTNGIQLDGFPGKPKRFVRWGSVVALIAEPRGARAESEDENLAAALKDGKVVLHLPGGEWIRMSLVDALGQTAGRVVERIRNAQAQAAQDRERLLDVMEDEARPQQDRIAAASELARRLDHRSRRGLDDGSRSRLRIAAASFVEPRIRIAIEKAAGASDEAEMEEALAALETEAGAKREL